MAKIVSQNIVITLSKLVKGNAETGSFVEPETVAQLEDLIAQLIDDQNIVVEAQSFDPE